MSSLCSTKCETLSASGKNCHGSTGALVGSLGEPQEDGGHGDLFQEMFLLVNTNCRVRRAGSAFPGIATQRV